MGERHSEYGRDAEDWYVEPSWCIQRLLVRYPDITTIHDPCCGGGTIVDTAVACGLRATGADIADRSAGRFPVRDFLRCSVPRPSIVTNPPYRLAEQIAARALLLVPGGGIVAMLVQVKFLASQGRYRLFTAPEMERVIMFSRRPSMPPGKLLAERGEACRGGGSIDFAWCIWRVGKARPGCVMEWTL